MAETRENALPAVIADMLRNPRKFAFIQIVRLLHMWTGKRRYQEWMEILRTRLRFRSSLSLGFAVTDVDDLEIEPSQDPQDTCPFASARITASFLGLYGPTSPLPTFYTERLLEEQAEDGSVMRDFLDICNNVFFQIYVRLAALISPLDSAFGSDNPASRHMLMSLAGFGNASLRERLQDEQTFLRYAGFFSQSVRSASGLGAVLTDASGGSTARIRCNVERFARVPEEQRLRLGESSCLLGEDAVLGFTVPCREGKVIVEFADLDAKTLRSLVPGARLSGLLHGLVVNYCREPLEYETALHMAPREALPARLGGDADGAWATLGHDAWTGWGGEEAAEALPRASALFTAGFAPACLFRLPAKKEPQRESQRN